MKKIGFALQVFSLAAMLPICAVLQMGRATKNLQENNRHSGIAERKQISLSFSNLKS